MTIRKSDPVGAIEIASRLGVKDTTVHMWEYRGLMPPPEFNAVNGGRAWEWLTILRWAGECGRAHSAASRKEFKARFGKDPAPPHRGGRPAKAVATRAVR